MKSSTEFCNPAHRCAMGGPSRAPPALLDVPSSIPAVGVFGRDARHIRSARGRPTPSRRTPPPRSFHRRELRSRKKKGGLGVGKAKRGKGTKIMAVADSAGFPVAVCAESATPHEVTLVPQTLAEIFVVEPVQRLIGDNAYEFRPARSGTGRERSGNDRSSP